MLHRILLVGHSQVVIHRLVDIGDGGRSSVYMLLSLVNKETALAFLIGQPLGGWNRQNRMLGRRQ